MAELKSMWKKNIKKTKLFKGNEFERELSLKYHQQFLPILVSSRLLKKRSAGQIDLCIYQKKEIVIIEAKSGQVGEFSGAVSKKQTHRLRLTQLCLSSWFGKNCQLVVEVEENCPSF